MSWVTKILGIDRLERQVVRANQRADRFRNAIAAGAKATKGQYNGIGSDASSGEDALNQEYLRNLGAVQQRAQDLDANNPDVRGFHRTRTAQILGAGVQFRCHPHPDEVGVEAAALGKIAGQVDRLRALHSRLGGFDNSGKRRSEGTQQVRAFLTACVVGSCLVHRVWRYERGIPLPLRVELIPGNRISTPYDRAADPLISYGVQYADEHRSRVVGYHVRRVFMSRGNSAVPDYTWDYIPIEDGSLMELTEMAGLDRALPLAVANVRMLRNRGEFLEAAVESARVQAGIYAATEVEQGANPYDRALDDSEELGDGSAGSPAGFVQVGAGVKMLYLNSGEKINWNSARLPDPDFPGFMDKTDERLARGFSSSLSRFTRKVTSSWAGGRMEDQQDDPLVAQYRATVQACWQRVHEWFMEALWLTDAVDLPGYADATAPYWSEARVTWPGKLHINPQDTAKARSIAFGLRTATPQQACEEDGTNFSDNLRQWAQAIKACREMEKEYGLEDGDLEILLTGKVLSTTAGEDIAPPAADPEDPPNATKPGGHKNRIARFLNRIRQEDRL